MKFSFRPRLYHFAYLAILVIIAGGIQLLYWTFFPRVVFRLNRPVRILTPSVKPGQVLRYEIDYCKGYLAADLVADVKYSLQDSLVYNLAGNYGDPLSPGCHQVIEGVTIPNVPPGTYNLVISRHYRVNPIRDFASIGISSEFLIRP